MNAYILQVTETVQFPFNDPVCHKLKVVFMFVAQKINLIILYIKAA
jgi:hypothetical protein